MRIVDIIARSAPDFSGKVPVRWLCDELQRSWAWPRNEVHTALLELAEAALVTLHEEGDFIDPLERRDGLRRKDGVLISAVGVALQTRARRKRPLHIRFTPIH